MTRARALHWLALAAVTGLALAVRLFGLDWDQGHHLHPDERFLSIVLTQIRPPTDLAMYFDPATSPYSPFNQGVEFFVYGTLPLFLVDGLSRLLDMQGYDQAYLVGRAASAIADTGTVVLVYLLGRRLLGAWPGLLAALLMALSVHAIQLSHFFTVDTFATFFSTAALWLLVRAARRPRWLDLGLLGLAIGLALASKLSAGLLLVLAAGWWAMEGWRGRHLRSGESAAAAWIARGALVAVSAAIAFRVAQPYAFASASPLDWRLGDAFLSAVAQQQAIQTGDFDWPPGVQWAGTTPYLYPLEQVVRWGVGPAFGLAALAGIGASVAVLWRGHRHPLVAPLAWAALTFGYGGALVLKTMRYFHPLYPVLALVAAWVLAELWRRRDRIPRVPGRLAARVIVVGGGLMVAATAAWAAAFMQLYARDHSRVEASAWIHANVPAGATVLTEHWDDQLPLGLPGRPHDRYAFGQLRVFDRENADKRVHLMQALSSADAIVLSSDRGAATIPRMPQRYPLAGRYYEALWDGALGFRLAAQFESRPSLGPWTFDDSRAEEAFTVYDHPRVSVFVRDAPHVGSLVAASLADVDERGAVAVLPKVAQEAPILFTPQDAATVRREAGWPNVYRERPLEGWAAVLAWYGAGLGLTLALWPLLARALGLLPDAGYAAARVLAPALAVLPAWWLASVGLARFDTPSIVGGAGALALVSAAAWSRNRTPWSALRPRLGSALIVEAVFLGAWAGFLALRAANPDLWHPVFGGEKPMDYAHLNAIIRTPAFPPHDPWYAGGHLNYYYYGHVPTAALSKALGVPPGTAYNLALAGYAAAMVAGVFAVGHGVWALLRKPGRRAVGVGLAAALLVVVAGNLQSAVQLVEIAANHAADPASGWSVLAQIPATIGGDLAADYDLWAPTRVIPDTVNEFPWFTFTYGDLHPHLMNLAATAAALLGALALVALGERRRSGGPAPWSSWAAVLAFQALVLGLHRVANPWDFPTYLVVTLATLAYGLWRSGGLPGRTVIALTAGAGVGLIAASQLLFQPFHQHYVEFYGGVIPTPQTTSAFQWLLIFGMPTAIGLTLAARMVAPALAGALRGGDRVLRTGAAAVPALLAVAALAAALIWGAEPWSARLWLAGLVGTVGLAAWRARDRPEVLVPLALFGAAALLTAIPEIVAVRDDIGRLNTVFKSHLQAWVLAGLGAAIALPQVAHALWRRRSPWTVPLRAAWSLVLVGLLAVALIYPAAATPHKLNLRIQPLPATLDGEAFMDGGEILDEGKPIGLTSDLLALTWLRDHVSGAPTIVEGPTTIYRWGGRASAYTGLPSVVGWDWHARQQHWGYVHAVDARIDDVEELFETHNRFRARTLLDRYGVDLIYIGPLERAHHEGPALAKFAAMGDLGVTPVYAEGEVTIYRVTPVPERPATGPRG